MPSFRLLRRMSQREVVLVGGVLVDRAVLRQRFACVSDRCAPGPADASLPPLYEAMRNDLDWPGIGDVCL